MLQCENASGYYYTRECEYYFSVFAQRSFTTVTFSSASESYALSLYQLIIFSFSLQLCVFYFHYSSRILLKMLICFLFYFQLVSILYFCLRFFLKFFILINFLLFTDFVDLITLLDAKFSFFSLLFFFYTFIIFFTLLFVLFFIYSFTISTLASAT